MRTCEVCDRQAVAKGLCHGHYKRMVRYGTPTGHPPDGPSREERFWAKVSRESLSGCWEWTGAVLKSTGYGNFDRQGAHRVSYELTYGPIPPGMYVCHRCDNRPCVNPAHLFLGSASDNLKDMVAKGRDPKPGAKLTVADVVEVHQMLASGMTKRAIAAHFKLKSASTITFIQNGQTWTGVWTARQQLKRAREADSHLG